MLMSQEKAKAKDAGYLSSLPTESYVEGKHFQLNF